MISIYCSLLCKMFKQRKYANQLMDRGELYKKYLEYGSDIYKTGSVINGLNKSTDFQF